MVQVRSEIRRRDWHVLDTEWTNELTIYFATPIDEEDEVAPLLAGLTRTEPQVKRSGTIRQQVPYSAR